MRDPLYRLDFAKALAGIGVCAGASVPKECLDNYVIPLFDTDFYIVAFRVQGGHHEPCCVQEISYVPIPREDPIGNTLCAVFAPFGPVLRKMKIEEHLKREFRELFADDAYVNATHDNPLEFPLDQEGRAIVQDYYKDLTSEVVDGEIGRVLLSPAMHQAGISRFLLCTKVFDRRDIRFGHYFYDIKIHIPSAQRKQIVNKLTNSTMDRLTHFCDPEAAAWVRERVQSGQHDSIFALLDTPLSRCSRLFCEYTLLSGAAILNVDPFSRGDIGWYHKEDSRDEQTDDFKNEMRRFASIHYILLSMAANLARPALLTIPIRVDGATWMSVTTVVQTNQHPDYSVIVDVDEFQRRFFFYHSLMRDFETHIRKKSKQRYLGAVSRILSKKEIQVQRAFERSSSARTNRDVAKDFAALAKELLNLCRFYPYKPILFGPRGAARRYRWNEVRLGDGYDMDCGIAGQNPYFDRMHLREFLSNEEVSVRVREVMNSEVGLQEILKRGLAIVSGTTL